MYWELAGLNTSNNYILDMQISHMVQVIDANQTGKVDSAGKRKIRVCAYCRVSSASSEQRASYEAQVAHYTGYIGGSTSEAATTRKRMG
jgi:hypothetical protein